MNEDKEKNQFIEKLKILNEVKDDIIKEIQRIKPKDISKTQAQNLRESAVQTGSIEEVLLYIDYQCAKKKIPKDSGRELMTLIEKHKAEGIEIIRYMMGVFARHVIIQNEE